MRVLASLACRIACAGSPLLALAVAGLAPRWSWRSICRRWSPAPTTSRSSTSCRSRPPGTRSHERILTTIDLAVVESWKGGAAPATHFTVVQPGGTVGDSDDGRPRHAALLAGRARGRVPARRAPSAPASSGWRRASASCAARRLGPLDGARPRQGGRDVRPHHAGQRDRRRCSRPARARSRICAPRCARSPRKPRPDQPGKPGDDRRAAVKRAALAASPRCAAGLSRAPAAAYVRYKSNNGKMFKWSQTCVADHGLPDDFTAMMTARRDPGRRRRLRRHLERRRRRLHLPRRSRVALVDGRRRRARPTTAATRHLPQPRTGAS